MMEDMPDCCETEDSERFYKNLNGLVKTLEEKGVDKEQLKQIADEDNLKDCSYGSERNFYDISGVIWGVIAGAGACWASNKLCHYWGVSDFMRYGANILSAGFGFLSMIRGHQLMQEDKDRLFYSALKDRFGRQISEQ